MTIHALLDQNAAGSPAPLRPPVLDERPNRWPDDARRALRDVTAELDAWCRANDWPAMMNRSFAEEAVRRAWR